MPHSLPILEVQWPIGICLPTTPGPRPTRDHHLRDHHCAWATSSTFGFVAPATPVSPPNDDDYDDLRATMVHMRSDIEFRAD